MSIKKLIPIIIVLAFILPSFAHADITSNLQGWWKLDDGTGTTPIDSSTNGYNGTFNFGTNPAPTWVTGKIGPYALNRTGALIGGSNNQIDIGDQTNLRISGNLTVSMWIKFTASQSNEPILMRGDTGYSYAMFVDYSSANKIRMYINSGSTAYTAASASTYNDGNWHMVTGVYDGAHVKLYIDGGATETVTGSAYTGAISTAAHEVCIYAYCGQGTAAYDGSVDDIRIYNRALSSGDITQLYAYTGNAVANFTSFIVKLGTTFKVMLGTTFQTR